MSFKFSKKNQDSTFRNYQYETINHDYGKEWSSIKLESAPPSYNELGKQSRDLFSSGYHFGLLSLNIITKTPKCVKFTTTLIENLHQGNLFGSLEAKYNFPNSLVLTEKWNTDCTMTTELCCKNKPFKGLNTTFTGSIFPRSGDKMGVIKAEWANKFCSFNSQLEIRNKFSMFTSSVVFGYKGFLGGVQARFDAFTTKLNDINFAAGYSNECFILHATFSKGSECGGSIFHKVTPKVDAGVEVLYSMNTKSDILFGLAGRYQVHDDVCIRGKINNYNHLGLGYEQKLKDCIILTFSALFDTRSFPDGKHKLGLSIQFES